MTIAFLLASILIGCQSNGSEEMNPNAKSVDKSKGIIVPVGCADIPHRTFTNAKTAYLDGNPEECLKRLNRATVFMEAVAKNSDLQSREHLKQSIQALEKLKEAINNGDSPSLDQMNQVFSEVFRALAKHNMALADHYWPPSDTKVQPPAK